MQRVLAIGDIHGCVKTFKHLLIHEFKILKSDVVVCVGDYIDRGPDSKGVIDFILELKASGYAVHTLRGNHEQIMIDSINSSIVKEVWVKNGGDQTLKSFGIDDYGQFSEEYRTFFEGTLHYLTHTNHIFVHAGLNMEIENPFNDKKAMLWIRGFKTHSFLNDRILIHGHTPIPLDQLVIQQSNIINVDGGCVYAEREGLGNLIGYNIYDRTFMSVKNMDV
jgi:serine/threonine protein phosphatase 1